MTHDPFDTQPIPRPLVLVVGLALDASDDVVWHETIRLARHAEPSILHVCHVVEAKPNDVSTIAGEQRRPIVDIRESALRAYIDRRSTDDLQPIHASIWVHVLEGRTADRIAQLAAARGADAIVVGSVGSRGPGEMDLDSTALSLFRSSPCSVVLARPKDTSAVPRPFRASMNDAMGTSGQRAH